MAKKTYKELQSKEMRNLQEEYERSAIERAEKLITVLEDTKTSNKHDRIVHLNILKDCVTRYKKYGDTWKWETQGLVKNRCRNAEAFLYRVLAKYDRH